MRQFYWAAAEHLLSPFSSPFFGVKWLYDFGFWSAWTQSHKSSFTPKKGLEKVLLNQLAAFVLVINIFLLPPCFVHRVHTKPPVFREGTLIPSFVNTKVFSLLSSCCSKPLSNWGGAHRLFYNYGSWWRIGCDQHRKILDIRRTPSSSYFFDEGTVNPT